MSRVNRLGGFPPSLQNSLEVAHPVQHTHDLNGFRLRIVDDEVGIDRPEFHRPACEIVANVTCFRLAAEKVQRASDFLHNPARDCRARLLDEVALNLVQVPFRRLGENETLHLGTERSAASSSASMRSKTSSPSTNSRRLADCQPSSI